MIQLRTLNLMFNFIDCIQKEKKKRRPVLYIYTCTRMEGGNKGKWTHHTNLMHDSQAKDLLFLTSCIYFYMDMESSNHIKLLSSLFFFFSGKEYKVTLKIKTKRIRKVKRLQAFVTHHVCIGAQISIFPTYDGPQWRRARASFKSWTELKKNEDNAHGHGSCCYVTV